AIIDKQLELYMDRIKGWFNPDQMQIFLCDLIVSALVLVFTYILIKVLYRFLNRILREGGQGDSEQAEKGGISDEAIRSTRILLQTIILYGGYFIAAIVILEIFNVKLISPDDLKTLGA
ncbi:MAG TPA: mechanosensitive ion channel family protein, partial [Pelotomaculum sp.]|nr:mechanosensitive ion channel family protein [Pelotomaculum sp.]